MRIYFLFLIASAWAKCDFPDPGRPTNRIIKLPCMLLDDAFVAPANDAVALIFNLRLGFFATVSHPPSSPSLASMSFICTSAV